MKTETEINAWFVERVSEIDDAFRDRAYQGWISDDNYNGTLRALAACRRIMLEKAWAEDQKKFIQDQVCLHETRDSTGKCADCRKRVPPI